MSPVKKQRRKPYERGGRDQFTQITDRDRRIFRALFDYRYLTFEQLAFLVPPHETSQSQAGHEKKLRERLTELYHSDHVDRIRTQSYPSVYTLSARAADHLAAEDDEFQRLEWIKKSKTATWHFIEHTIEVAEFRIALETKITATPRVRLVTGRPLVAAVRAATTGKPTQHPLLLKRDITLDVFDGRAGKTLKRTDAVGTVPDHLFLLQVAKNKQRIFGVEIDRGSMPIKHRGFSGSSIERKLHVYHSAAQSKDPRDRWGADAFRVLFVTDSPARSEHIRKLARALGTDICWTAERDTVLREPLLSEYWLDPQGRGHALLPRKLVPGG